MADTSTRDVKSVPPSPKPVAPPPRVRPEKIQPEHTDVTNPVRPFRYSWAFVKGTVEGLLNGMSSGGRKGMYFGFWGSTALWFMTPYVALPAVLAITSAWTIPFIAVCGLLAGTAISGALGLLTGGSRGVGREIRREKYADDLAVKEEVRRDRVAHRADYRDLYTKHRNAASYNIDRLQQQEHDREQQSWRERMEARHDHGRNRGF